MTQRLVRIEYLMTTMTLVAAALVLATGIARPFGVALGGAAALLDFTMIRRLGAAVLTRQTPLARIVSLALAKSVVLLAVPAMALLLPRSLVDGVSFAIGVTTLPVAVVVDACMPLAAHGRV
jgi:hypothetical protein